MGPSGQPGLKDVRVLVTRPRERAGPLCFMLEDEGAEVMAIPFLELLPPSDPRPLRAAAEQVRRYSWAALASPSAVEALVEAVQRAGTLAELKQVKLAVVGPGTARAVQRSGLVTSLAAEPATGLGLAQSLLSRLTPDDSVLFPVAEAGRREGLELLRQAGISLAEVPAYRTEGLGADDAVWDELRRRPPHLVVFASPRTVTAFLDGGPQARALLEGSRVVAMGPTTQAALRSHGIQAAATAERPTDEGLVEAAILAAVLR
jgi:uroporphyrinogen-III synthase